MDLEKSTLEQSQGNGLAPTTVESLESIGSQRPRRRRWPWFLMFCVIVAGAYALLMYMGQAARIEEWKTRLTQMAVAAYEQLPLPGRETTPKSQAPGKPGAGSKTAATPAPRTPPTIPVVTAAARAGEFRCLPDWPRVCDSVKHGDGPCQGRWAARQSGVPGRTNRPPG